MSETRPGGFDLLGSLAASHGAESAGATTSAGPGQADATPCSRRGCRAGAVWALRWNNPRIHAPERRKTWLACDEHRTHLSTFLGDRGFLRETLTVAELTRNPEETQ